MKQNMGSRDRKIRVILALIIIFFIFTNNITGALALLLFFLVGVLVLTSFINFCPIYYPFGINTKKNKHT
jgi:hypothetical protein